MFAKWINSIRLKGSYIVSKDRIPNPEVPDSFLRKITESPVDFSPLSLFIRMELSLRWNLLPTPPPPFLTLDLSTPSHRQILEDLSRLSLCSLLNCVQSTPLPFLFEIVTSLRRGTWLISIWLTLAGNNQMHAEAWSMTRVTFENGDKQGDKSQTSENWVMT